MPDSAPSSNGLAALLRRGGRPGPVPARFALDGLRAAAKRVEDRWPGQEPPDEKDRDAILKELAIRLHRGDWSGCRLSLVCAGIRAAFHETRRAHEALADLRAFFYEEIAATDRPSVLNAAFLAYIESFDPSSVHTRNLGRALAKAQKTLPPRAERLRKSFPRLFQPQDIVSDIARAMIAAENPYSRMLELGVQSPHGPGLMDHVHLEFVKSTADRLSRETACKQLLAWLKPKGRPERRQGAAEAVQALLKPWTRKDPDTKLQSFLTRTLVDMYGDPRRMSGYPWHAVGNAERAVFLRWLTGENLRLLFDAITDTMSDDAEKRMWAARRKFYLKLHAEKRIKNAWVAFAPAGARRARQILEASGSGSGMEFGQQIARGARSNTSLLIAHVSNKIVVDGSHSYKVHVFKDDDPRAPELFQRTYDCEQIRHSLPDRDKKAHLGDWQQWVLMRI